MRANITLAALLALTFGCYLGCYLKGASYEIAAWSAINMWVAVGLVKFGHWWLKDEE